MATKPKVDSRNLQGRSVFQKAVDHKTVYANVVRTSVTPFDIRIVFGQVTDVQPGDTSTRAEDLVTVIMAPEEAKAMLPYVQRAVEGYTRAYGEIRDIPARLKEMEEAVQAGSAAEVGTSSKRKKS